jgi:hypothetical protein
MLTSITPIARKLVFGARTVREVAIVDCIAPVTRLYVLLEGGGILAAFARNVREALHDTSGKWTGAELIC